MKCLLQVTQLIHIGPGTNARDMVLSVFSSERSLLGPMASADGGLAVLASAGAD